MDNNSKVGIAILVGLGILGLLFFITRKAGVPMPTPAPLSPNGGYVGPGGIRPLRLMPAGSVAKQYTNKEEWAIDWNEDGLPTKLVISRHATQT